VTSHNWRRARRFGGGFRFRRYAGQPAAELEEVPVPDLVRIPLAQGFPAVESALGGSRYPIRALKPTVHVGQSVRTGEVVGRDDDAISTPVHSSVSGTVSAIDELPLGGRIVPAVVVRTGAPEQVLHVDGYSEQWQSLSAERIEQMLHLAGVTGLGPEGIPSRFGSAAIGPDEVEDVIVHHAGTDVLNPSPRVLLAAARRLNFLAGLRILGRVLPKARLHVVLSVEERELLDSLGQMARKAERVQVWGIEPKYPGASPELLTMTVLGREFPFGYSAASIGLVLLDVQSVLHAFQAVVEGRVVTERIVAMSGTGFARPTHVRARIGTALRDVVAGRTVTTDPVRVILGGVMTGTDASDLALPLDRTATQVVALPAGDRRLPLAFIRPSLQWDSWTRSFPANWLPAARHADVNLKGEERPCVQCGACAAVCPVRIIPSLIHRSLRAGVGEAQMRYGVQQCIDCNLCTFVCPSKIALAASMRETKAKLVETGCDNWSCLVPKQDLKGLEEYKGVRSVR
jgi:Na(+)-translocating NADH:ubiquinone oxidoreductase A subunit